MSEPIKRSYGGLYRGVLWGLLRGMLGVFTIAYMMSRVCVGRPFGQIIRTIVGDNIEK